MSDTVEHFIEYALSKGCPAAFDTAYKEGLAPALLEQARDDVQKMEGDRCNALASSDKVQQESVKKKLGMNPKMTRPRLGSEGLPQARVAGAQDAKDGEIMWKI